MHKCHIREPTTLNIFVNQTEMSSLEDFKYKNAYNPLTPPTVNNSKTGGQFGKLKVKF